MEKERLTTEAVQRMFDSTQVARGETMANCQLPLIDGKSAAKILGVSYSGFRALVKSENIPHIKLGRLVKFDPSDLQKFIERKKQSPLPA